MSNLYTKCGMETLIFSGMTETKTWKDRLNAAKHADKFTQEDRKLAMGWNTCVVGEKVRLQDKGIKAVEMVIDNTAACLGIVFYCAVSNDNVALAIDLYQQIQSTKKLIKEVD